MEYTIADIADRYSYICVCVYRYIGLEITHNQ